MSIVRRIRNAAVIVWWTPSWWMTRLIVWHKPDSVWKRTPNIYYLIEYATPLFRQLNGLLWMVLIQLFILAVLLYLK